MDALQLFSIVLGVTGLVGGGAGYFWKNRGETIIQLQAKEIEYWKDKTSQEASDKDKALVENQTLRQQNADILGNLGKSIREAVRHAAKHNGK